MQTLDIANDVPPVEVSKARIRRLRAEQVELKKKAQYKFDSQLNWFIKSVEREAVVNALRQVTA